MILVDIKNYIVNGNEMLEREILKKWQCYHSDIFDVYHKKLSIYNSVCARKWHGLSIKTMNDFNSLLKWMGYPGVFASAGKIRAEEKKYMANSWREYWNTAPASRFLKSFSKNRNHGSIHVYNIDAREAISRNHDASINNDDNQDFDHLFGKDIYCFISADKCTSDGMQSLGLFAQSVSVCLVNKLASAYTGTVIESCFGNIKDTSPFFHRLYEQNDKRNKISSLFKRPIIVVTCIYNDYSRLVSSGVLAYDTKIHVKLNAKIDIEQARNEWNQTHPIESICVNSNDIKAEIATEYECVNSRAKNILGMDVIKKQRKARVNKVKFQWYQTMHTFIESLDLLTIEDQSLLPIKGMSADLEGKRAEEMNEEEKCLQNFFQRSVKNRDTSELPYYDEFKFNVCKNYLLSIECLLPTLFVGLFVDMHGCLLPTLFVTLFVN